MRPHQVDHFLILHGVPSPVHPTRAFLLVQNFDERNLIGGYAAAGLPSSVRYKPVPGKILALTPENRRAYANLAVSASQGNIPKPPPGYKLNRTKGFPLESLDMLFGHVLNALGPEIATASPPPATDKGDDAGASAGSKRARSPGPDEGSGSKRGLGNDGRRTIATGGDKGDSSTGSNSGSKARGSGGGVGRRSPMEVYGDRGAGENSKGGVKNEKKAEPEPVVDHVQEGLDSARKAFSRVLRLWEGVAAEGKRGLHQRVVARLGRMLAEAEAAAAARRRGKKESRLESESPTESMASICANKCLCAAGSA